ncbi:uncharacterized protein LOC112890328 [Panicum hallii]|uniref:uncharacterized protein LOC112890328 n=1 Tax=Panicum hallii TaxID=206008 RepID=UPI000DF4D598|nr:uncharacterized protein LOC112890328 [Panicum hallii]
MQQLARHGDTDIDELKAVEKYLRVVPSKYAQLALSIETLLDLSTLSIEEVTERLKAVDDRDEGVAGDPVSIGGKLLFTEEQWLARQKERKKKQDGSSSSKDARQQPRKKGGSGDKPSGDKPAGGTEGKEGACGVSVRLHAATPASTAAAAAIGPGTAGSPRRVLRPTWPKPTRTTSPPCGWPKPAQSCSSWREKGGSFRLHQVHRCSTSTSRERTPSSATAPATTSSKGGTWTAVPRTT